MEIRSNKELVEAVDAAIQESGYKKAWIAEQLGISKQAFANFMNKANFSLDDANKILSIIGSVAIVEVNKKDVK